MATQQPNEEKAAYWLLAYQSHLEQRLDLTRVYLSTQSQVDARNHANSFLTLLNEAHRFPALTPKVLAIIALLHPMPLRWGLGHRWEVELKFAIDQLADSETETKAAYACDLGEIARARGNFGEALQWFDIALTAIGVPFTQAARACRGAFTCYRATGDQDKANHLIHALCNQFYGDSAAVSVPLDMTRAWLHYQQCRLELMREQGKIDQALLLVEEMIQMDDAVDAPDPSLTAELLTHRSTLLWVRGRYDQAVTDLKRATELFLAIEDEFQASALKSNLGLVYWTMGELDFAEQTLLASIQFYRQTGSDQLRTYDVANLGLVHFARGNLDIALRLTEEHVALAQEINFVHEVHRGRRNLGTILYYFGAYEQSIVETNVAHQYYQNRGSRDAYFLDILWLALCHAAQGEQETAVRLAEEVLEQARQLNSPVLEQISLRTLAKFVNVPKLDLLRQSYEMAVRLDRKFEIAAVHLMLAGAKTGNDQQQSWDLGKRQLQEIGAEQWLKGHAPEAPPFLPLLL